MSRRDWEPLTKSERIAALIFYGPVVAIIAVTAAIIWSLT